MLGGRDSSDTTCSWRSWSSLESSMVTMRSSLGTKRRQDVEQRRLPGVGTARDDDVEPAHHARLDEPGQGRGDGHVRDEVLDLQGVLGELPDGEERPADGEGVDHGVDTGAVGQAGVDHGRGLVDAPADLTDDLVDDAAQVGLVDEARRASARSCRRARRRPCRAR